MKKIIILAIDYIFKTIIPAFGLIFLLFAGNTVTFILGLAITILSFYWYLQETK